MILDYRNYKIDEIKARLSNTSQKSAVNVLVVGATGVGKSTTLNAVFKKNLARVGIGCNPETMSLSKYCLNDYIYLWDSPGLGDSPEADRQHSTNIIKKLKETDDDGKLLIDLVLIILDGGTRDLGTSYKLISTVIIPNLTGDKRKKVLIAINQADMVMKGHHWKKNTNSPDIVLREHLKEKSKSIQQRIKDDTGIEIIRPVCYSAYYNWNLTGLYNHILRFIPRNSK